MDFLESAAILLPAATGMAFTIYDGDPNILTQFEQQYCFAPQFQPIYTVSGMMALFENGTDQLIYELIDPLGSYLVAVKVERDWILLGPCVEDGWHEHTARSLLVELGIPEKAISSYKAYRCKLPISKKDYTLKMAFVLVKQLDSEGMKRRIKTIRTDPRQDKIHLPLSSDYGDVAVTSKRYSLEDAFILAISKGDIENAYKAMRGWKKTSSNLKFISDDLDSQIAGAAALRTLVRMGAKLAGLSPVRIDSISQEYAQRMRHTASKKELDYLVAHLIEQFCSEIRDMQESNYCPAVRKAMDYMDSNLSNSLDSTKVAEMLGMERRLFVRTFSKETGMSVKQYLAKKRCEIAAGLLRSSQSSIQNIAAYVGYTDNNYFSKIFKANQGCTPQDYRKNHWPTK